MDNPEYHVRDISDYTIISDSFVRHGSLGRSDGSKMPVVMVVNDEAKIVFAYSLREVDALVNQILAQRAISASMEKPVTQGEFREIMGGDDVL